MSLQVIIIISVIIIGVAFGICLKSGVDWYSDRGNGMAKNRLKELGLEENEKYDEYMNRSRESENYLQFGKDKKQDGEE